MPDLLWTAWTLTKSHQKVEIRMVITTNRIAANIAALVNMVIIWLIVGVALIAIIASIPHVLAGDTYNFMAFLVPWAAGVAAFLTVAIFCGMTAHLIMIRQSLDELVRLSQEQKKLLGQALTEKTPDLEPSNPLA